MAIVENGTASVEYGLDALDLPASGHEPWSRRLVKVVVPKLVALALLLGVWELISGVFKVATDRVPPPGDVWASFTQLWSDGTVLSAIGTSLWHGAEGYAIALAIGTPLGLLIARVRVVRYAIGSIIAALLSLPSVCWAPIALFWFNLSPFLITFVVVMGAFPSIAGGTVAAVDQIPPLLLRVGDAMGARGFAKYRHIVLPAALPGFVAGLKQGWAFAWHALMAGEVIAIIAKKPSLGVSLQNSREFSDYPSLYASLLVIIFIGIAVDGLVFGRLQKTVLRRRGLVGGQ